MRVNICQNERYADSCVIMEYLLWQKPCIVDALTLRKSNWSSLPWWNFLSNCPSIYSKAWKSAYFQQPHDRFHVANVCTQHLWQNNIAILLWPALSTNLSPIEHLLDEFDKVFADVISHRSRWTSFKPCWRWDNIPKAFIQRLAG